MAIKNGNSYRVKFVKHNEVNGTPITRFSIGEKIRGTDPAEWVNFSVTIWDDVQIYDGDEVKLTNLRDFDVSKGKDGRFFYGLSADIDNGQGKPRQQKPKEEKPKVDLSDCTLPFDLG